ncbi:GNAT family N-acetyltransferase [Anaerosolibacter sp.]|uniref:GNAT family N-acetyltransferase n=1 Tax=Anaerosolibacter sp. TaxID=1872527 RepID=UPI0039EE2458
MIIRRLEKKDIDAAKALWRYAFESQEPFCSWYFDEVLVPENLVGIFIENDLAACLQLNPYRLWLNGNSFDTSYVVGVITNPAYRHRGLTKELMTAAMIEMNHKGHGVSILMPFDTSFYSTYGWELCYSQLRYEIPMDMLKSFGHSQGNFVSVNARDHWDALQSIYTAHLKKYHGYIQRSPRDWEVLVQDLRHDGGYSYLLIDDTGSPAGYIFYFLKDGILNVRELAYISHWAKKSLIHFIYRHKSQVSKAVWPAPVGDMDFLFLRDTIKPLHTNIIRVLPFMAGRVINVKKALETCRYSKDISLSFSLEISDTYCPWNNGIFSVVIQDCIPSVQKMKGVQPDLSCNINTFSRLFFGAVNLDQALFMEEALLHTPEHLASLGKIFQQRNNFINEYF